MDQGAFPVRRVGAFLALPVLIAVFLGLGAAGAAASQVQPVSITACVSHEEGGCSNQSSVRVDQGFGLGVDFRVTNMLPPGGAIYVRAPEGTVFRPGITGKVNLNVGLTGYAVPSNNVQIIEGGRSLSVTVPSYVSPPITSGLDVRLALGYFNDLIQTPPVPGQFGVELWTSSDTDGRASDNTLTTTIGLPGALNPEGDAIGPVTGEFTDPPSATVTDSRGNALAGEDVTFSLPDSGPSGTFTGGATSFTGTSGADGVVTAPLVTANEVAGEWFVELTGPNSLEGTVDMVNVPTEATEIALSLDPSELPADGTAKADAEFLVSDEFGNRIVGDEIAVDTGGGPSASTPEYDSDGLYTFELTASTAPGEYTVTVTDSSVTPAVTSSQTLRQTVLPAVSASIELSPASLPADGKSQSVARVRVKNRIGGPVSGAQVALSSNGGQAIGPVVEGQGGVFTAPVTSTTTPGGSTITAKVTSVVPNLTATASLTQTEVPTPPDPPDPPPVVKPVVKFKSGPKGKVRKAKVKFRFAVTKGKATGFQCKLDKRKWAKCKSPKTVKVKRGRHVFQVRAIGIDGKPGKAIKRKFKRIG